MKKQWIIIASIVASIAIVLSLIVLGFQNTYQTTEQEKHVFIKNFASKINHLNAVKFQFNNQTVILRKNKAGNWLVKDKNYPVDRKKLNQFLLALNESQFIEKKTNQPSRFDKLGLNPSAALKVGLTIENKEKTNRETITFDLGKYSDTRKGTYVKLAEQNHAWLVSGNLDANQFKTDWLEKNLFNIPQDQVKQLILVRIEKNQPPNWLELNKKTSEQPEFTISFKNKPMNKEDIKEHLPYTLSSIWQNFNIQDIKPALELEKPVAEESIILTTFSGLVLKAQLFKVEKKVQGRTLYWVAFSAEKDQQGQENMDTEIAQINTYKPWVYRLDDFKISLFKQKQADIFADKSR